MVFDVLKENEMLVGEIILRAFFSIDYREVNLNGNPITLIYAETV